MDFDINQIALLSRIKLEAGERESLSEDLKKILAYVEKLSELPTDDVLPTSHVLEIENVFREDQVKPVQVIEQALEHAPNREENFFKVPKIIEDN